MPSLLASGLELGLAGAHDAIRRYRLRILLAALAALVATMGLAMLAGAVFLQLARTMTPAASAAATGGGLVVVAGLVALAVVPLGHRNVRRPAAGGADVAALLAAAEAAIARDARAEPPMFALLALVAGSAIGASPTLRRILADLAR